jgi:hypothetical protein
MNLPKPEPAYSQQNEAAARAEMEREDKRHIKLGADIVFSGDASDPHPRLIGVSPNGTRYRILIDNSGAISTAAI